MMTMSISLALITIAIEFSLVKRFKWMFYMAVGYPLFSMGVSLSLSVILSALFGATGVVMLTASGMSILGSWIFYRLYWAAASIKSKIRPSVKEAA